MAKKFEKIMPGVVLVGRTAANPGIVYFRKMVNGKRKIKKSSVQGALALDERGRATKALKAEAANWAASLMNEAYIEKREGALEMTFEDLIEQYEKAASLERIKSGRPSQSSAQNAVKGVRLFLLNAGLKLENKCSKATSDVFDIAITSMIKNGKSKETAWCYAAAMQSVTARWTAPYYKREGFEPPKFELPSRRNMRPERYARPTKEQLDGVKKWYEDLWQDPDKRKWFAATMMLQFAMRNGDVCRATEDIFKPRMFRSADGSLVERMVLCYKPHKTSQSSGRNVAWPVAKSLWERMEEASKVIAVWKEELADKATGWTWRNREEESGHLIPYAKRVFERINKDLRKIFQDSYKASYELRKICVDHVYQTLGIEKASAISGDDPKTVMYYYADPSQAIEEDGIDITELM